MKNLIITVILMTVAMNILYSQDIIDPPPIDLIKNDTINDFINRNVNKFVLGWNLGSEGKALDDALYINTYHGYPLNSTNGTTGQNMNIIPPLGWWGNNIVGGRNYDIVFNGHSLFLEPSIALGTPNSFVPKSCDLTGGVFGFKNRDLVVGDDTWDCKRFTLYKDSVTNSVVVLDSIWKGDILRWLDYILI